MIYRPLTYKVWCPERGETEDSVRYIVAARPTEAAERYAERECEEDPSAADRYLNDVPTLRVKDEYGGACDVVVEAEVSLHFHSRRLVPSTGLHDLPSRVMFFRESAEEDK